MSNNETFTILSVGAPLVEVDGHGPSTDRAGGLAVPDGAATTASIHLLTEFVRRWRVDAPATVQATVSVTDSPFGSFVGLRRCGAPADAGINRIVVTNGIDRWPWLRAKLKRYAPSLLALVYLYTDETPAPCDWQDIGDNNQSQVNARGGDIVVVTFVVP